MKRNILAVVIPALLAAGKANAVEIYNKDGNNLDLYGKVFGLHSFSNDKKENQDQSYARLGFKGETQITDQLTGYAQWEYNLESNPSKSQDINSDKTHLGFAGLKFANYGSFDYGRNYGILSNVEKWTDTLPKFSNDNHAAHDFMINSTNGVATYRNNDLFGLFDGLNFAVQYQAKNNGDEKNNKVKNNEGWGFSSTYDIDENISIGATYAYADKIKTKKSTDPEPNTSKPTDKHEPSKKDNDKNKAWTVGTKYHADNIYLAAIYAETRNILPSGSTITESANNRMHKFEVTAQYQFDFGLRPAVSYLQTKGNNGTKTTNVKNNQDMLKYIAVGTTYDFNKNISTYVNYKINLLKSNDFTKATNITTDNVFAVGMVYQF